MSAPTDWQVLTTQDGRSYYRNKVTNKTQWEKPDVLKTSADRDLGGEWVWVPDDFHGYIPCKLLELVEKGDQMVQAEDGRTIRVPKKEVDLLLPLIREDLKKNVDDLVQMERCDEGSVIWNLKGRFAVSSIYTNIGTILVSVNPYRKIEGIYGEAIMNQYRNKGLRQLPPHIYDIANSAFNLMCEGETSNSFARQAILISGESGAGKTEATKHVLAFLADTAGSVDASIRDKILLLNPVLEAFGNAKTTVNDNSSRFGKWMEVYFDDRRRICGSTITNYLLEKARVTHLGRGERNFHIFYQLTAGCDAHERQHFHLGRPEDYVWCFEGGTATVPGVDDAKDFREVKEALIRIGFTPEEEDQMFRIVAGILHLGNVVIRQKGEDGSQVANHDELEMAAELLNLPADLIESAICFRTIQVRGQEPVRKPLSAVNANANKSALAKMMYGNMFDWLVQRLNDFIRPERAVETYDVIGVLDIFGFEIFESNSFEQLCINFANEKLQQHFNRHTFKLEEQLYKDEQIQFTHIVFIDNQPVLDLIELKPNGLIPLLDETVVIDADDNAFMVKVNNAHDRKTERYTRNFKEGNVFTVAHYAGLVKYDANGFVLKNRDTLETDLLNLMFESNHELIHKIFPRNMSTRDRKVTLGSQFRDQLGLLMKVLNVSTPHYVRCIKPNHSKSAQKWEGLNALKQLRYSGIFEAVRIRQTGYPFRYTHREFVMRYQCLHANARTSDDITTCQAVIAAVGADMREIQLGRTRVLYRAGVHRMLELLRSYEVERRTIKGQCVFRAYRARKLFKKMKEVDGILRAAIDSRNLERLEAVLAQCRDLWFPMRSLRIAEALAQRLREEIRINGELQRVQDLDPEKCYDQIMAIVYAAEKIEMEGPILDRVRSRVQRVRQVRETAKFLKEGAKNYDKAMLVRAIATATELGMYAAEVDEAKRVLAYIEEEEKFINKLDRALKGKVADIAGLEAVIKDAEAFNFRSQEGRDALALAGATLKLRKALVADFMLIATWDALAEAVTAFEAIGKGESPEVSACRDKIKLRGKLEGVAGRLEAALPLVDLDALTKEIARGEELSMGATPWAPPFKKALAVLDTLARIDKATSAAFSDAGALRAALGQGEALGLRTGGGERTMVVGEAILALRVGLSRDFALLESWDALEGFLSRAESLSLAHSEVGAAAEKRNLRRALEANRRRVTSATAACGRAELEGALAAASELGMATTPWGDVLPAATTVLEAIVELESAIATRDPKTARLAAAISRCASLGFRNSGGRRLLEVGEATLALRTALRADFSQAVEAWDAVEAALATAEDLSMDSREVVEARARRDLRVSLEDTEEALEAAVAAASRPDLTTGIERAKSLDMANTPWRDIVLESSRVLEAVVALENAIARWESNVNELKRSIALADSLGFRNTGGKPLLLVAEATLVLRNTLRGDFLQLPAWEAVMSALSHAESLGMSSPEVSAANDKRVLKGQMESVNAKLTAAVAAASRDDLASLLSRAGQLEMSKSPWRANVTAAARVHEAILALEAAIARQDGDLLALSTAISVGVSLGFKNTRGAALLDVAEATLALRKDLKVEFMEILDWDVIEADLQRAEELNMDSPEVNSALQIRATRKQMEKISASLEGASRACDRGALSQELNAAKKLNMSASPWRAVVAHATRVLDAITALTNAIGKWTDSVSDITAALTTAESLGFRGNGGRTLYDEAEAVLRLRMALKGNFTEVVAWDRVEATLARALELGLELPETVKGTERKELRRQLEVATASVERAIKAGDRDGLAGALRTCESLGLASTPWRAVGVHGSSVLAAIVKLEAAIANSNDLDVSSLQLALTNADYLKLRDTGVRDLVYRGEAVLGLRRALRAEFSELSDWEEVEKCLEVAEQLSIEGVEVKDARARKALRAHMEKIASSLEGGVSACDGLALASALKAAEKAQMSSSPWRATVTKASRIHAAIVALQESIDTWDENLTQISNAIGTAEALGMGSSGGRALIEEAVAVANLRRALKGNFMELSAWTMVEKTADVVEDLGLEGLPEQRAAADRAEMQRTLSTLAAELVTAARDCNVSVLEAKIAAGTAKDMAASPWAGSLHRAVEVLTAVSRINAAVQRTDGDCIALATALAAAENSRIGESGPVARGLLDRARAVLSLRKALSASFESLSDWEAVEAALETAKGTGLSSGPEFDDASSRVALRVKLEKIAASLESSTSTFNRVDLESSITAGRRSHLNVTPWAPALAKAIKVSTTLNDLYTAMEGGLDNTELLQNAIYAAETLGFDSGAHGADVLRRARILLTVRTVLTRDDSVMKTWDSIDEALILAEEADVSGQDVAMARAWHDRRVAIEDAASAIASAVAAASKDRLNAALEAARKLGMENTPWREAVSSGARVAAALMDMDKAIATPGDAAPLATTINRVNALGLSKSPAGRDVIQRAEALLNVRLALALPLSDLESWNSVERSLSNAESLQLRGPDLENAASRRALRKELEKLSTSLEDAFARCSRDNLVSLLAAAQRLDMSATPWASSLKKAVALNDVLLTLTHAMERFDTTADLQSAILMANSLGLRGTASGRLLLEKAEALQRLRLALSADFSVAKSFDLLEDAYEAGAALNLDGDEMDVALERKETRLDLEALASSLDAAIEACDTDALRLRLERGGRLAMMESPWRETMTRASRCLEAVTSLALAVNNKSEPTGNSKAALVGPSTKDPLYVALTKFQGLNLTSTKARALYASANSLYDLRRALAANFETLNDYDNLASALKAAEAAGVVGMEVSAATSRCRQRAEMESLAAKLTKAIPVCDVDTISDCVERGTAAHMELSPWSDIFAEGQEALESLRTIVNGLKKGVARVDEAYLVKALRIAERMGFESDEVTSARMLRDQILFLKDATMEALAFHDLPALQKCVKRAGTIGLKSSYVMEAHRMINEIQGKNVEAVPDAFFDSLLKRTVDLDDYPYLRVKTEARRGILSWQSSDLSTSLVKMSSEDAEIAVVFFHNLVIYMEGGTRGRAQAVTPVQVMAKLVGASARLRDEIYLQCMKQLTNNPSNESALRGWRVLSEALNTFPPSMDLESYVEYFVRTFTPNTGRVGPDDLVEALHDIIFSPSSLKTWPRDDGWLASV